MAPMIRSTDIHPIDDRGGRLLVMYWTEFSICIIVVFLRFYSRIKIRSVGLDDWVMLLTLVTKTPHTFWFGSIWQRILIPDPWPNGCSSSNPQCVSRWCPPPLPNRPLQYHVRPQDQLGSSTLCNYGPRHSQNFRRLFNATHHPLRYSLGSTHSTLCHRFYLPNLCHSVDFDICTMQSPEGVMGVRGQGSQVLGPESSEWLRDIFCFLEFVYRHKSRIIAYSYYLEVADAGEEEVGNLWTSWAGNTCWGKLHNQGYETPRSAA